MKYLLAALLALTLASTSDAQVILGAGHPSSPQYGYYPYVPYAVPYCRGVTAACSMVAGFTAEIAGYCSFTRIGLWRRLQRCSLCGASDSWAGWGSKGFASPLSSRPPPSLHKG